MEITVKMTVEEFQQFVAWQKEQDYYEKELDKELNKREILAKKTCWAIDADPKKPGKVKIIDQDHAAELLESDIPILYQVPGRNTSRKKRRGHGPV